MSSSTTVPVPRQGGRDADDPISNLFVEAFKIDWSATGMQPEVDR